MKIRVAFITGGLGRGGAENQLVLLGRHLDRSRFEPSVVAIGQPLAAVEAHLAQPCVDVLLKNGPPSAAEQRWLHDEEYYYYVHRMIRPVVPIEIVPRTRGLSPSVFQALYRHLRSHRPSIVQTWGWLSEFYSVGAGVAAGVPIIVGGDRGSGASTYPLLIKLQCAITDRIRRRFMTAIVANSESGGEALRRKGMDPANVHVIGNGIEEFTPDWRRAAEFRARHGLDRQQFVVGLIAGFRPVKNHAMLLRAMRRLRDRIPATAVLVGDGPLRGEIVRMSHDLGIQDSVVLAGWVPDPKPIYACFDVLVSTSHSEGFSNSIGEAMMAGVPVVATHVAGNCDLIQSGFNGILVPPEDHEALADQLYLLATDAALRQRMSAAAQKWVRENCSVARMVRRYETLYSSLCASKGIYALEADADAATADSEV